MIDRELLIAVFNVVECITKAELTNTARTLICNYYAGSEQPTRALRARESVFRYAQCRSLPRLEDIRQKRREQLDRLEHLVLRMEYEAARLDGVWPPAPEPALAPGAAPAAASFAETIPVQDNGPEHTASSEQATSVDQPMPVEETVLPSRRSTLITPPRPAKTAPAAPVKKTAPGRKAKARRKKISKNASPSGKGAKTISRKKAPPSRRSAVAHKPARKIQPAAGKKSSPKKRLKK